MRYCKECLYPQTHPLGLIIGEDGVCSGCKVHKEKFTLDWDARFKKLKKLTQRYKNKNNRSYDCIVPVSGGRDSYYIVHVVTKLLGLTPLLVRYNPHYNSRIGHRNYAYLKTLFDLDAFDAVVQPQKVKKITRYTLESLFSIHWHVVAGYTVFPVQVAVRFKIPLIIWGAHQGLEQVGMFSHLDEVEMTRKYRKEHDLMGVEAEDLVDKGDLSESDLLPYFYPDSKEIERVGVRGIYLGNYIPWDSKKQHEEMIRLYGYKTKQEPRTFDTYNTIDTLHYADLHDYIKYKKCGYGVATDHAVREIRWGRVTKEEGRRLVQHYQKAPLRYTQMFKEWLGVNELPFIDKNDFVVSHKSAEVEAIEKRLGFVQNASDYIEDKRFHLLQRGYED